MSTKNPQGDSEKPQRSPDEKNPSGDTSDDNTESNSEWVNPEPKSAPWYKLRATLYGTALLVIGIGLTVLFYTLYEARQSELSAPPGWSVVQEEDLRSLAQPAYWLGDNPGGMRVGKVLFAVPADLQTPTASEQGGSESAASEPGAGDSEEKTGDYALVSYVGSGEGEPVVSVFSSMVAEEQLKAFQSVVEACEKGDCPEGSEVINTPIGEGVAADRLDISTLTVMREDKTAVVLVVFQRGGVGEYAKQLSLLN